MIKHLRKDHPSLLENPEILTGDIDHFFMAKRVVGFLDFIIFEN